MLKTILLLLTVFFSGSHQQCFSNNDDVGPPSLDEYTNYLAATKNFSLNLLKAVYKQNENQNLVFSPSSIRNALLLAYFGASRKTEQSLAKVLQIPAGQKKALTWKIYHDENVMNVRIDLTDYPLKSVNKLYLSHKLSLRRCMKEKFDKELESINIDSEAKSAMTKINAWVEKETDGDILDFMKYLNPFSTAALVNAVTFKAKWLSGFDPSNTQILGFDGRGYPKEIFMLKDGTFDKAHSKELGAGLLLLRHEGSRSAMIIVLPDNPRGLDEVIQKLDETTLEFITNKNNYKITNLRLIIPKLNKRSNVHLESVLERLGIGNAFTVNADFSEFTGRNNVFITEVVHEASVRIEEEGSEASLGSGSTFERRSGLKEEEPFMCDHPFLYMMYDFFGRKIVLMGTFSGN